MHDRNPSLDRVPYADPPRQRNNRKIHITLSLANIGYLHSEAKLANCSISEIANAALNHARTNLRTGTDPEAGTDDYRR